MYLQIKQLSKSYGSRQVVSNIDLAMQEGEILSLLGPSGCGKTTILRMIAGLVKPEGGFIQVGDRVFYDGRRDLPVEERGLGMVFQDYALWPHMTVEKNIAFGMQLRRMPSRRIKQRVHELLDLVNLPGLQHRYPYQLSGGQQQRVAVARALATAPRVLLLDEPLSSLDTALRETMGAELVQLFKRLKITTINVTHDQNEAMNVSDRIMVLRDGQVQQVGSPTGLYLYPANAFVASFMGPANMFSGEFVQADSSSALPALRLHMAGEGNQLLNGTVRSETLACLNGQANLFCRPDAVRAYAQEPAAELANVLPGAVLHASFVAGRWRTLVALDEAQQHVVLAFASSQLQPQQRIWLEFPPEQCQIVPA